MIFDVDLNHDLKRNHRVKSFDLNHIHPAEEEEDSAYTARSIAWELMHFIALLAAGKGC